MKARTVWCLMVALEVVAPSACIRESDPLDAHPDVVAVEVLLIAGESEARLLAIHPHRHRTAAAPSITATLEGPGWTAIFSDEIDMEACTRADVWGPARCLHAALPEPIRPGTGYGIKGTALLGSFRGAMLVPDVPLLFEPADSLLLSGPTGGGPVPLPIRYRTGSGAGTLLAELLDFRRTNDDGTETELNPSNFGYPRQLRMEQDADTLPIRYRDKPVRFSLRLLGIGWNYTNFLAHVGRFPVPQPWPSFGIEGEGVYGYFDGAAPSRAVHVRVSGSSEAPAELRFTAVAVPGPTQFSLFPVHTKGRLE